jgi:hypothetical protein
MRPILWIVVFFLVSVCAVGIMFYPPASSAAWEVRHDPTELGLSCDDTPVASRIAVAYFLFLSLGLYWMLYDSCQHDKRFTRKMWLFFVPGGFLWYYFERFRPRQLSKHQRVHS